MSPKSELPEEGLPEVVNLIDSQAEKIEADLVRSSRSYIGNLTANESDMNQAVALNVNAHELNANTSILGVSQSVTSSSDNSILLASRAKRMELKNSLVGGVYADNANLAEGARTGILVSGKVSGEQIHTVFLVARHVEGPVETMLETRQVVLASVLAGVACGVVIMLGKLLFRHKK
jgi:hypothetical protein